VGGIGIGVLVVAAGVAAGGLLGARLLARRRRLRAWVERSGALAPLLLCEGLFWAAVFAAWFATAALVGDDDEIPNAVGVVLYLLTVIGGSALKVLVLAALWFELQRFYATLGERRASALGAAALLALGLLAVYAPMVAFRDGLASALDLSATTHLTAHEFAGYDFDREDRERHEAWLADWGSGRIPAGEALFLVLLAGTHALLGRFLGRRRILGPAAGVAATILLALAACSALGLVTFTYDVFHDGTVAGPLAFELLLPFAVMLPETLLVAPYFLVFALVARWTLRPARSGAPAPAPAPA